MHHGKEQQKRTLFYTLSFDTMRALDGLPLKPINDASVYEMQISKGEHYSL